VDSGGRMPHYGSLIFCLVVNNFVAYEFQEGNKRLKVKIEGLIQGM
jgi:hypothetical protein